MMRWVSPMALAFLTVIPLGCAQPQQPGQSQRAPQPPPPPMPDAHAASTTPLDKLALPAGMTREAAEHAIAAALGKERSDYSPYGNNLRGGIVQYSDPTGAVILEVTYAPGSPAPWVIPPNGGPAEHYPPVDESVISFRILRK